MSSAELQIKEELNFPLVVCGRSKVRNGRTGKGDGEGWKSGLKEVVVQLESEAILLHCYAVYQFTGEN